MTSIINPDVLTEPVGNTEQTDDTVNTNTVSTNTVDIDTVNSWLDQLKLIGIELRDTNGDPVVVNEENLDEVASAVKSITATQVGSANETENGDADGDEENLPPFELPETYREAAGRESLSETKGFTDHLNTHWGF
jgi:hypothetical protein